MTDRNVTAAVLVIGNEILSGRTRDANIGWLASELTGLGIRLREARVVADLEAEIISAVIEACRQGGFEYVSDMNIVENGLIESDYYESAILLVDWINLSKKVYTN